MGRQGSKAAHVLSLQGDIEMPSAQRAITLLFCPILHSSDPFFSHSRSWGVRQPSRQTPPSSSWDGLWDVQLAWTKKKAFVVWRNSTSILKVCLMRALGHAVSLWPVASFFSRRKMQPSRLGGWTACLPAPYEQRGSGRFVACRAQRLPSFICPGSSDPGP